jgi:hypothetical protein
VDYTNKLKKYRPTPAVTPLPPPPSSSSSKIGDATTFQWELLLTEEYKIWKNILIHEEIVFILKKSEMDKLIERMDLLPPATTNSSNNLAELLGYSSNQLENILKSFYSILFTISLSSELEKLINPILREEIRVEISKSISDSYSKVKALLFFINNFLFLTFRVK